MCMELDGRSRLGYRWGGEHWVSGRWVLDFILCPLSWRCASHQSLHCTDSSVSSFYVPECFPLSYWYFWRQALSYLGHYQNVCTVLQILICQKCIIKSLFRTLDSFMFTVCSAQCRYKVQESFSAKWATIREYESSHPVCYPSGHSSPTAGNTHGIIWVLSEYLNPKAHSCEGSKQWPLVARVCQKLSTSMTVCDNVKEAWGSTCFQSLEENLLRVAPWLGEKATKGKSVGHFKCNCFILFLWRLQGWPDFKCDLLYTDINFLDDRLKSRATDFSTFEGPVLPELTAAGSSRWVLVALGMVSRATVRFGVGRVVSVEDET